MKRIKWFYHPLFIFIFSLVALATSLFIYIRSYLQVNEALGTFVAKHKLDASQFLDSETWVIILVLSILVGIIILGMAVIYLYYQKMIQLYRMQQNFINGFTHELKTPIASLRLFLDTFTRHDLPRSDQKRYLEYMIRDTERLSENVARILNLATIEDRRYRPEFVSTDLITLGEDALSKLGPLPNHGVVILEKKEGESWPYPIDPSLFEILFTNLVINGLTYNKSDKPKVKISFSKDSKHLRIYFEDNGLGISKFHRKKVFKKFYQIGKNSKGSGLGLYIVSQIVRLHHGKIKLHQTDEGSLFEVILPLKGGK